ncbi:hypothetical protein HB780_05550 (plasmid) [Rhizobium lusitanum]|uniref:hypothetical protein n=1 Tax=Rhizobium lusitanum TaxID=293958 RepID=UPI00161D28F1|nr:hypothetical protein [Rhizobium lusitanum]QND45220.1 hypothetical protein HB780_05550 [Rhizobium lusitanum]
MTDPIVVSDHAILRYLERAHGLDIEAVRRHIAARCETGVRLGAAGVVIEKVKFIIEDGVVVTTLKARWPTKGGAG